jgi:hypothetical protein
VDVLAKSLADAIGVSSLSMLTTAVSFGASINSPISSIRQYALFQTACVIAEYVLILLLLVPAMIFFRRRLFFLHKTDRPAGDAEGPHVETARLLQPGLVEGLVTGSVPCPSGQ